MVWAHPRWRCEFLWFSEVAVWYSGANPLGWLVVFLPPRNSNTYKHNDTRAPFTGCFCVIHTCGVPPIAILCTTGILMVSRRGLSHQFTLSMHTKNQRTLADVKIKKSDRKVWIKHFTGELSSRAVQRKLNLTNTRYYSMCRVFLQEAINRGQVKAEELFID